MRGALVCQYCPALFYHYTALRQHVIDVHDRKTY